MARRPEGIVEQDVASLVAIFERAEDTIIKEIERVDITGRRPRNQLLEQIQEILQALAPTAVDRIGKLAEEEYTSGIEDVDKALEGVDESLRGGFSVVDPEAVGFIALSLDEIMEGVKKEVRDTLAESYKLIRRNLTLIPDEIQQEIINRVAIGQATGRARSRISKELLDEIYRARDKGLFDPTKESSIIEYTKKKKIVPKQMASYYRTQSITAFQYTTEGGKTKSLSLKAWSEGLARSTLRTSNWSATVGRSLERGHDLMKISRHSQPSRMCRKWQGKIISISGNNPDYPSMKEATFNGDYKRGGIGHRFCRHSLRVYIPTDIKFD